MTVQKQGKHGPAQNPRDPDFAGAEGSSAQGCRKLAPPGHGDDRCSCCTQRRESRVGDGRRNIHR